MKSNIRFCTKNGAILLLTAVFLCAGSGFIAAQVPTSPLGADAVPDLYAPNLAGPGGFVTTTGGAPASALNPAQGGSAHRMVFDAGYLAIPALPYGDEKNGSVYVHKEDKEYISNEYMQSLEIGALFPTKYGVFGGSLRGIFGFQEKINQFDYFPIGNTFSGNLSAAKEVYPGMSVGMGINFGVGADWTLSADFGFHYDTGKNLGPFKNFVWAAALRGMGKSYFPTWFTPTAGLSFDLVHVEGKNGKPDPFVWNFSGDLGIPSLFYFPKTSMILKFGFDMTIAEIVSFSFSWPGASGVNARELAEAPNQKNVFQPIPSVGLGVNILLPSDGKRIAGGRLPSDGDLKIDTAFRPLYEGVTAIGGGATWYVGMKDKKPPLINVDYPDIIYFSPNYDGKVDYLEFPIAITDDNYVTGWQVEIKDAEGNVIRTIENKEQRPVSRNAKDFFSRLFAVKKQVEVPPEIRWDGLRQEGDMAPDGNYFITITAKDDSDNGAASQTYQAVLKNTPPEISITPMSGAQLIFNPMGGEKNNIAFNMSGSEEEAWESGIWNAAGEKVRTFVAIKGQPKQQVWDGKTDAGQVAPDGVYSYRIGATDRAQNSANAAMDNIILDGRVAGIFLTSSVPRIAPKPNQSANLVDFAIRLSLQEGVESWKLELKDDSGASLRSFSGSARAPANQGWNGLDDKGAIREGTYTPELTVRYTRGDEVKTSATKVTVDVSGPKLSLAYTPEYFSPDNDGEEDELFINLAAQDVSPIAGWSLEIREPEPPYPVFRRFEGRGSPVGRLVWDGKSDKGELVQSATDYPCTFTAEDILGNASSIEDKIGVDVLVIRDGDRLKIQIPSIVFRPNFADFEGLSKEIVDNNTRIIRRIAQILNKFRDYKVQVEGHANPTSPPGPARDREEPELKRLSEARARAVVDLLVRYGVTRSRLYYIGEGGSRPLVPYEDRDNWWKNRRVEFILIK